MWHLAQGLSSFSGLDGAKQWAQLLVGDEGEGSVVDLDVCHVMRLGWGVPVEDEAAADDSSFIFAHP